MKNFLQMATKLKCSLTMCYNYSKILKQTICESLKIIHLQRRAKIKILLTKLSKNGCISLNNLFTPLSTAVVFVDPSKTVCKTNVRRSALIRIRGSKRPEFRLITSLQTKKKHIYNYRLRN